MEPTPITVPLCWRHGLDLNILYKREWGFCRLDVFYWVQGLWAQFILRCPGHSAEEPFWDLFSSLGVWVMTNPKFYSPWKIPFTVVILFYFVPHSRDGGSSFLFCCKLLLFTLYFGQSVGLGFTYSLSSLGIWVWPIESSFSHLLGDYGPCLVGLGFKKKGVSTLLFLWIKKFHTNFESLRYI